MPTNVSLPGMSLPSTLTPGSVQEVQPPRASRKLYFVHNETTCHDAIA